MNTTTPPSQVVKDHYHRSLNWKNGRIDMSHGAGGRAMQQLIEELFLSAFDNPALVARDDQALLPTPSELAAGGRLVMATDSHVVSPLFFAGGDIGSLSIHGTVNDLAMAGAKPLALSAGFILEEGLPLADLKTIVMSMAKAAKEVGVPIVTGDTKVVEAGKGDGVFINTTGIGVTRPHCLLSGHRVQAGDSIILSGFMGDHGIAIMSQREGLSFGTHLTSDSQSLYDLVSVMLDTGADIHALRDPTRGGVGSTLNEIATQASVGMIIEEKSIPIRGEVRAACELLGLDPLYVANEGKLLAFCAAEDTDRVLNAMRAHPKGRDAALIGKVVVDNNHFVKMETLLGGMRMVDWLTGEQLPRIC